MQNNIIIELNEREAIHKMQNGEWISNLSKSVIIEEGDTIQLKATMIDAVAQSSEQITIPKDLNLVLKFGIYYNDWLPLWQASPDTPNEFLFYTFLNNAGATVEKFLGDGRYLIPYKKVSGTDTGFSKCTGWAFQNNSNQNSAPFEVQYSYININNQLTYFTHNIPSQPKEKDFEDPFSLVFKDNSLKIVSKLPSSIVSYGPIDVEPIINERLYAPYDFEAVILLPKGNYTASELSLFISKELSKNNTSPLNQGTNINYINNPFLKNSSMFKTGQAQPDGHGGTIDEVVFFVRYDVDGVSNFDGAMILEDTPAGVTINNSLFIGASQIALDYDDQASQFKWSYLHTPLLDSATGKNISIKYLNNNNDISCIGAHSGIYFTNLHAEDMEGNLFDFWGGILGMNVDNITVDYQNILNDRFNINSSSWVVLEPLVLSKNITSAYIGIDSAIIKTATTWMKQQIIPSTDQINWIDSTADPNTTNEIKAAIKLPELQNTFSHYFIDLGMKFQNELIGVDEVYRSYNGIVNKYYNFGSYIYSSDGEGSIVYQHKGSAITLKSVKCAIRKSSDRQVDENLGSNSCIYMQVIKASPKP